MFASLEVRLTDTRSDIAKAEERRDMLKQGNEEEAVRADEQKKKVNSF
jgi:hypothetical protein